MRRQKLGDDEFFGKTVGKLHVNGEEFVELTLEYVDLKGKCNYLLNYVNIINWLKLKIFILYKR